MQRKKKKITFSECCHAVILSEFLECELSESPRNVNDQCLVEIAVYSDTPDFDKHWAKERKRIFDYIKVLLLS